MLNYRRHVVATPFAKVAVVADSLAGQCNSALVTVASVCLALSGS